MNVVALSQGPGARPQSWGRRAGHPGSRPRRPAPPAPSHPEPGLPASGEGCRCSAGRVLGARGPSKAAWNPNIPPRLQSLLAQAPSHCLHPLSRHPDSHVPPARATGTPNCGAAWPERGPSFVGAGSTPSSTRSQNPDLSQGAGWRGRRPGAGGQRGSPTRAGQAGPLPTQSRCQGPQGHGGAGLGPRHTAQQGRVCPGAGAVPSCTAARGALPGPSSKVWGKLRQGQGGLPAPRLLPAVQAGGSQRPSPAGERGAQGKSSFPSCETGRGTLAGQP